MPLPRVVGAQGEVQGEQQPLEPPVEADGLHAPDVQGQLHARPPWTVHKKQEKLLDTPSIP